MEKIFTKSDHTTPHDHTENLMPALTARVELHAAACWVFWEIRNEMPTNPGAEYPAT